MHCAIRRKLPGLLPGLLLRRGFSSSAIRHEIRDVAALPRRLIPEYQGAARVFEVRFGD